MKKALSGLFVLLWLLMPGIVLADAEMEDSLGQLMALTGLSQHISELPAMIQSAVERAKDNTTLISDEQFKDVQASIESAFQASDILSAIRVVVKNNLSETEAKNLLDWYRSDLGRKISATDQKASTPSGYQEMFQTAQSLLADKQRVLLAKRIDGLVHATEMGLQLEQITQVAIFAAFTSVKNPDRPLNVDLFRTSMSGMNQQGRSQIEQFVILSYLYGYKEIHLEGIEKYISFLERRAARRFNDSIARAMNCALNKSIEKMAASLATLYQTKAK